MAPRRSSAAFIICILLKKHKTKERIKGAYKLDWTKKQFEKKTSFHVGEVKNTLVIGVPRRIHVDYRQISTFYSCKCRDIRYLKVMEKKTHLHYFIVKK